MEPVIAFGFYQSATAFYVTVTSLTLPSPIMPSILNLSPEIILKISYGSQIVDVLNFSRSCGYIRSISLSNRSFWTGAEGAFTLVPVPPGNTLTSITDISILPRYFARAVSISNKLYANPHQSMEPLRSTELRHIYPLPEWKKVLNQPPPRPLLPISLPPFLCPPRVGLVHTLPGARLFLVSSGYQDRCNCWFAIFGISCNSSYVADNLGELHELDWDSEDNGGVITITALFVNKTKQREFRVYSIQFDNASSSFDVSFLAAEILPGPSSNSVGICIKSPLVVLFGQDGLFTFNFKTGFRELRNLPSGLEVLSFHFHPLLLGGWISIVSHDTLQEFLAFAALPTAEDMQVPSVSSDWPTSPLIYTEIFDFEDRCCVLHFVRSSTTTSTTSMTCFIRKRQIETWELTIQGTTTLSSVSEIHQLPSLRKQDKGIIRDLKTSNKRKVLIIESFEGEALKIIWSDASSYPARAQIPRALSYPRMLSDPKNSNFTVYAPVFSFDDVYGLLIISDGDNLFAVQY